MRFHRLPGAALMLAAAVPAAAQDGAIGRLFSYELSDRPAFEEGYRAHLGRHAERKDALAWHAWYVTEGTRKGSFIDGTFGTTIAALDARPDPKGDGADFQKTAGPHARSTGIETWALWQAPSTATPLEERRPTASLRALMLSVPADGVAAFERAVAAAAASKRPGAALSWYRRVEDKPGTEAGYLLLENGGAAELPTLQAMLAAAYEGGAFIPGAAVGRAEIWTYAPRLALMPGEPVPR